MSDFPQSRAADFLLGRINFERQPPSASQHAFKVDRMRQLLRVLGSPQEQMPAVHIAGTKGKGSTAMMVASALRASGIGTGLYTSPHIESFTERLWFDGAHPTDAEFDSLLPEVASAIKQVDGDSTGPGVTYFEAMTAMAWVYFVRRGAELVVLEVGLGGRLDATNVCVPEVTAITNISRDHTNILGETIEEIAAEKAGIIKAGVPCVLGEMPERAAEVIRKVAEGRGAPVMESAGRYDAIPPAREGDSWRIGLRDGWNGLEENGGATWRVPLRGAHQVKNATVALLVLKSLAERGWKIGHVDVGRGWDTMAWPARIEVVGEEPTVLIDAAHNWASTSALVATVEQDFGRRRRVLLFAGNQEKDVAGILSLLAPHFDSVVLTAFQGNSRGMPLGQLETLWFAVTGRPAHRCETPEEGLALCRRIARPEDLICVAGSFFLAAEVRPLVVSSST